MAQVVESLPLQKTRSNLSGRVNTMVADGLEVEIAATVLTLLSRSIQVWAPKRVEYVGWSQFISVSCVYMNVLFIVMHMIT